MDMTFNGAPICRAQLGAAIADNFQNFIDKAFKESTRDPQYRVGPDGISFSKLVLISLVNVCDGVWMADIAVDMR